MFYNSSVLHFSMELYDFSIKHPSEKPRMVKITNNYSALSYNKGSSARFEKHMLSLVDRYGETTADLTKLTSTKLYTLSELLFPPLQDWKHTIDAWADVAPNHDLRKIRLEFLNDLKCLEREKAILRDQIDCDFFVLDNGARADLYFDNKVELETPTAQVRTHQLTENGLVNPVNYIGLEPLPNVLSRVLKYYKLIPNTSDETDGGDKSLSELVFNLTIGSV